jgi:hypothetical protein
VRGDDIKFFNDYRPEAKSLVNLYEVLTLTACTLQEKVKSKIKTSIINWKGMFEIPIGAPCVLQICHEWNPDWTPFISFMTAADSFSRWFCQRRSLGS